MLDFLNVLIISATSEVSKELSTIAKTKGILVIDDGSTFRMDDKVPLVVPEVNAYDIDWHKGIISTPNCTTTPLVMVIDSLRNLETVIRVNVSTYQAVTGTGSLAKRELIDQTKAMINDNLKIKAISVQNSWLELDSYDDFKLYAQLYENKRLKEFFNILN